MASLTERIAIVIEAQGAKAVAEFNKVGNAAEKLLGRAEKSGGIASKTLERLGIRGEMAGAAISAGLAIGAQAVIRFGADAIKAASDLGEQQAATNTIFGEGADIIDDFARQASSSIGVSRRAALEASNAFGDLFLNVGFTEKQAARLSTGLVQLAGDLASFKNLRTDDVLAKLQSGLVGEAEPLKALGILINEAAVKSKAMELGLGGANRELTEGEKVAARYALIIEKTKNAQGDVARTSDSLANRQRRLNAEWEDSKASLGRSLIPFASAATDTLADLITVQDSASESSKLGAFEWRKNAGFLDQLSDVMIGYEGSTSDAAATSNLLAQAERDLGLAAGALAEYTKDEGKAHEIAAQAAEKHRQAVDRMNEASIAGLSAELAYERSLNSVEDANLKAAEAQKKLNDATANYGAKSPQVAAAAEALSRAQLELKGDLLGVAAAASAVAQKQAEASGEQFDAVDSARAQIVALENQRKKFPELSPVIDAYIDKLNQIPGVKRTALELVGSISGSLSRLGIPGFGRVDGGRATGGPVSPFGTYLVGERGPELLQMGRSSGRVIPNGGFGSATTVNIYMPPGSDGDDVVDAIKRYERRNGTAWRS